MKSALFSAFITIAAFASLNAAEIKEPLYPAGAPGAKGTGFDHEPALLWYPAPATNNTGAAIVIFPGGGYANLCYTYEGQEIGTWLNSHGISGIVCLYRMSRGGYRHPVPLQDAQRAIRTVRTRATEFGIAPDRIGVLGFSAGGHLASTTMTHFDSGNPQAEDPIEHASSRPDFGVLCYPVVQFDEASTHRGSQNNLICKDASPELVKFLSNEKQVTPQTPPAFIWCCNGDTVVPAENSTAFYLACRANKVPAELHIFRDGQHGGGLCQKDNLKDARGTWPDLCITWMRHSGFLK